MVKEVDDKIKKQLQKNRDRVKRQREDVAERLNRIASTEDGVFFLNHLMNTCGFQVTSVTDHPLGRDAVMYNEGRRSVWINVRNMLSVKFLKKIEFLKGQ